MTISLSGQSVLIVGAGGGVGRAALETFARQGAIVTAAGRPGDALSTAAAAAGVAPPRSISSTTMRWKPSSPPMPPSTMW